VTRSTDIVVTTIFEPAWLEGYLQNVERHGHRDSVTLRIVCDRKTPASVYEAAREAAARGFHVDCPTLEEQEKYLASLGAPADLIPWNTDNRRNIGFLRAWESGADVLISIDDDNYCRDDDDFVERHGCVGRPVGDDEMLQVADGGPWFNLCGRLQAEPSEAIFARGFPYAARRGELASLRAPSSEERRRRVTVNAGLWLDDPDVDALTRLVIGPKIRGADPHPVVLAAEVWSPINTQNTALIRELIPAYYYVRMGFALSGLKIDRFGDILSGYFVQKCAKAQGDVIRIGAPIAEHHRTPHNLFKDLYFELAGVVVVEELLPWLRELSLRGSSYRDCYAELSEALEAGSESFRGFVWDDGGREFLRDTARCMRTWLELVERLES
jgi:hypothetical protein